MRFIISLFCFFFSVYGFSQNALSLTSTDGKPFKVILKDSVFNKLLQAHVTIEKVLTDTLRFEIEFENKKKYPVTVYLLEKGQKSTLKEYDYRLSTDNSRLNLHYAGVYDQVKLPNPLVPLKPVIDTSLKYKNSLLGHFCELKNGRPLYFNNMPKEGNCTKSMPPEYMNYTALLMSKAQVEDEKYTIVENICRNNCMNVNQLNILLSYIGYEVEKLKLLRVGYFSLVDPENQKDLEKNFRFESSVNELRAFLKNSESYRIKTSETCSSASPQNEIDTYISRLAACANDAQKLELLKKNYSDFCYSIEQVISILQKFIHDREKLDASRLLYFKCAQRADYLKVSEAFSYNQSSSELKDFIDKQQR